MRCKFCFATFQDVKRTILPKGHLLKDDAIEVVHRLSAHRFQKITFAGGEPTLCPWLGELIRTAKSAGMTTMIVTNGTKLSDDFLSTNQDYLDWIAISVDSINPDTNLRIGRAVCGIKPFDKDDYMGIVDRITSYGYGLKINTVVNRLNFEEDMSEIIQYAKPQRWKIFQVLPVMGQNDATVDPFLISKEEFEYFIARHDVLKNVTTLVPENNSAIVGSYVMVDPAGRFFDDSNGCHTYSRPIVEAGCEQALNDVYHNYGKFISRGGLYEWQRT